MLTETSRHESSKKQKSSAPDNEADAVDAPKSPEPLCAAETTLPWKRQNDTPPVSSSRTHSAIEMATVSELPAWIAAPQDDNTVVNGDAHDTSVFSAGQPNGAFETEAEPDEGSDKDISGSPLVVVNGDINDGINSNSNLGCDKQTHVDIIITEPSPQISKRNSLKKANEDTSKHKEVPSEEIEPGESGEKAAPKD